MRYFLIVSIFLSSTFICLSQEQYEKAVDSLYKEDQFYAGVTYNLLANKPDNLSQNGFSLGFHFGFIKDIPLNERRNIALGLGLGYSANSFSQNLFITKEAGMIDYSLVDNSTFTANKFSNHFIEFPVEFRWRTSTASEYSFWRIYTGFKVGYMINHSAKHRGDLGNFKYRDIDSFNKFQYGLTMSLGYDTWNIFAYYGLNSIFSDDAVLNDESIDMKAVKLGLIFYIL